jgi:hypothetical protein
MKRFVSFESSPLLELRRHVGLELGRSRGFVSVVVVPVRSIHFLPAFNFVRAEMCDPIELNLSERRPLRWGVAEPVVRIHLLERERRRAMQFIDGEASLGQQTADLQLDEIGEAEISIVATAV